MLFRSLTGCPPELLADAERAAAENVKRVHRASDPLGQSLRDVTALVEFKTVWHPMGA